jgi:hypothetical protein
MDHQLNLNEWIRFTRPGEYVLSTVSGRISRKDPSSPGGTSAITVRGNDVTLKILAATPDWQKSVFDAAVSVLDVPAPAKPSDMEAYINSRKSAPETLRFLGNPESIRELANRMPGDHVALIGTYTMGLIGAPDPESAISAMEDSLRNPSHSIDYSFLNTLRAVSKQSAADVTQKLIEALPQKYGNAHAVSLSTALNEVWNGVQLPKQTVDALVQQLVASFDELPPGERNNLLRDRWDKIASPGDASASSAVRPGPRRFIGPVRQRVATLVRARSRGSETGHYQ